MLLILVDNWNVSTRCLEREVEKQVMGYKGAEYSSFRLKRDAKKYLKSKKKSKDGEGDHIAADQHDTVN